MRPTMWMSTFTGFATGRVIKYDVAGFTPDEKYLIADFGGRFGPGGACSESKTELAASGLANLDRLMRPLLLYRGHNSSGF